jgi:MFS family permease
VVGSGLCGSIYVVCPPMLGEFTPVSQRGAVIAIYGALYTLAGIIAPITMGAVIKHAANAARGLHDRLHHQRRDHGRLRCARPALALAQYRARKAHGSRRTAEVCVSGE